MYGLQMYLCFFKGRQHEFKKKSPQQATLTLLLHLPLEFLPVLSSTFYVRSIRAYRGNS